MPNNVQFINGNRFGWASLELGIDGVDEEDFTAVTYTADQSIGKVRGKGHRKKGRTRGESDSTGSLTMLKGAANRLIKRLGKGFMTGSRDFPITVNYADSAESEIFTDELQGCRIIKIADDPKQGTDPLTVTFDLDIGKILYNGIDPQE